MNCKILIEGYGLCCRDYHDMDAFFNSVPIAAKIYPTSLVSRTALRVCAAQAGAFEGALAREKGVAFVRLCERKTKPEHTGTRC